MWYCSRCRMKYDRQAGYRLPMVLAADSVTRYRPRLAAHPGTASHCWPEGTNTSSKSNGLLGLLKGRRRRGTVRCRRRHDSSTSL